MKTKRPNNLKMKIIMPILIVLLLFNFIVPNYSHAGWVDELKENISDIFITLLCKPFDAVNWLMNRYISDYGTVDVNNDGLSNDNEVAVEGDDTATGRKAFIDNTNKSGHPDEMFKYNANGTTQIEFTPAKEFTDGTDDYVLPRIRVTPITIFANKVSLLNANYFSADSNRLNLKGIVASWYNLFRLIAIVGLLSVLIYVGIRIVISSTAGEKAKYKTMLTDWLIALCLIFFLHYIMAFTMTMVDTITQALSGGDGNNINVTIENSGLSGHDPAKFSTNLVGVTRLKLHMNSQSEKWSYFIMYGALTFYTAYFAFVYIKRMLTLTFFTFIAPLVALTYPIDKIRDGKAQAFDYWLREYIMNAILPIIHLVLYQVFVTSAMDFASENPLYVIFVLAFIVPAEKIIKDMFGVRSNTAPKTGGFAGGALASQAINKLGGAMRGKGGGKDGKNNQGGKQDKIRTTDDNPTDSTGDGMDALAGAGAGSGAEDALPPPSGNQGGADDPGDTQSQNQPQTDQPLPPPAPEYDPRLTPEELDELKAEGLEPGDQEYDQYLAQRGYSQQSSSNNNDNSSDDNNNDNDSQEEESLPPPPPAPPQSNPNDAQASAHQATAVATQAQAQTQQQPAKRGKLKSAASHAARFVRKRYNIPKGARGVLTVAGRMAKATARGALKVTGAAMGASIGLAAGIVSGDMNDIWKGFAGGAAAGGALGKITADKAEQLGGAIVNKGRSIKDDWQSTGSVGSKEAANRKADREFMRDIHNQQHIEEMLEKEEKSSDYRSVQDRLKYYTQYRRAGVTDIKEMDRLYDMESDASKASGKASEENLEAARLSTYYSKDTFLDAGKYDKAKEAMSGQFMNADSNKTFQANKQKELEQKYLQEKELDKDGKETGKMKYTAEQAKELSIQEAQRQTKARADTQAEYTMQKIGTVKGVYKNNTSNTNTTANNTNTNNNTRTTTRRGRRGNNS